MTTGGANSTTISNQYITASSPRCRAYAAGTDHTISLIQETSNRIAITVGGAAADFSVTASPTSVTTTAGTAATSTITVAPTGGFTGTVALTSSISPSTGLTCTLTPSSITLGASQTSTLSCNGSAGTYTVTITGTEGSLSHSATATVPV